MLIDPQEAERRQLKFKGIRKLKRRRDRDDYDWKADPEKPPQISCLSGGYRSIKHKWLCQYIQQTSSPDGAQIGGREAETAINGGGLIESNSAPLSPDLEGGFQQGSGAKDLAGGSSEAQNPARRKSGNAAPQPKPVGPNGKHGRQSGDALMETEAKKCRKQAEIEVKASREEEALRQTESSLENDKLQLATKKARKEAEEELSLAAEQDRGAMAMKSLKRDLKDAGHPESPRGFRVLNQNGHPKAATTGNNVEKKATPRKRPVSSSGLKPPEDRISPQKQPSSKSNKPTDGQRRPSPHKQKMLENRKQSGMSSQSKEDVAENEGKGKGRETSPHVWKPVNGNHSKAIDSHPLVEVAFVDGSEKEHLGELDLYQLDSFRDLWLTIRSAFSARLPKGDFKLVYRDLDNDLMIQKGEPWDYFKRTACSLLLMSK